MMKDSEAKNNAASVGVEKYGRNLSESICFVLNKLPHLIIFRRNAAAS